MSSKKASKKLFQELPGSQDKARILSIVTQDRATIKARLNRTAEFETTPVVWTPPQRLEVKAPTLRLGLQSLTVQFDSRGERYFSRVQLAFDDWKLYFVFTEPIYRLQRREYQRLKLPVKYKNRVLLMQVNDKVWNEECEMIDVSLGGCSLRISYSALEIPTGSVVMMDLQAGDHPSFMQIGMICYKRPEKYLGRSVIRMGIKFRPHPKYSLHLQSLVQNLSIDLFTSWALKP